MALSSSSLLKAESENCQLQISAEIRSCSSGVNKDPSSFLQCTAGSSIRSHSRQVLNSFVVAFLLTYFRRERAPNCLALSRQPEGADIVEPNLKRVMSKCGVSPRHKYQRLVPRQTRLIFLPEKNGKEPIAKNQQTRLT